MAAFIPHALPALARSNSPRRSAMPATPPRKNMYVLVRNRLQCSIAGPRGGGSGGGGGIGGGTLTTILLTSVPALWGSYGVAAKYLYGMEPSMPVSVLNVGCFFFAAIAAALSAPFAKNSWRGVTAGVELGTYLYLGSWLNLEALARTSASKCAFWVQLSTIIVPILESTALGNKAPKKVYAAGALALAGSVALATGDAHVHAAAAPDALAHVQATGFNAGDAIAVGAAFFYSIHVIRLEQLLRHAKSKAQLVRDKCMTQLILSVGALALSSHSSEFTEYLLSLGVSSGSTVATSVGCTIWIGAFTTALATWAQVRGQERVGPSRAAVVYASQPVFALLLAVLAQVEMPSAQEALGAMLIALGAATVAWQPECGATKKELELKGQVEMENVM